MARRRMISADLLSDEHFNALSLEAQNIFVRMLAVSDDCGVVPANRYKLNVLINTPKSLSKRLDKILVEILDLGLGFRFDYGGEEYFAFKPGPFQDYQSYILNKARKSEYLRISKAEYMELSKKFSEVPRSSRNNFPSASCAVESREQKVVSRKQEVETTFDEYIPGGWTDILEVRSAMKNFELHRREIKEPMTVRAMTIMGRKLYDVSQGDPARAVKILEESIANGWKGIFELKQEKNGKASPSPDAGKSPATYFCTLCNKRWPKSQELTHPCKVHQETA